MRKIQFSDKPEWLFLIDSFVAFFNFKHVFIYYTIQGDVRQTFIFGVVRVGNGMHSILVWEQKQVVVAVGHICTNYLLFIRNVSDVEMRWSILINSTRKKKTNKFQSENKYVSRIESSIGQMYSACCRRRMNLFIDVVNKTENQKWIIYDKWTGDTSQNMSDKIYQTKLKRSYAQAHIHV